MSSGPGLHDSDVYQMYIDGSYKSGKRKRGITLESVGGGRAGWGAVLYRPGEDMSYHTIFGPVVTEVGGEGFVGAARASCGTAELSAAAEAAIFLLQQAKTDSSIITKKRKNHGQTR